MSAQIPVYTYRDGMAWDPPMTSWLQVQVRFKSSGLDPWGAEQWHYTDQSLDIQVSQPGVWRGPADHYGFGVFNGYPEIGTMFADNDGPYGVQYRYRFNPRYYTALPMRLKWRELNLATQADLGFFSAVIPAGGVWSNWLGTTALTFPGVLVTEIRDYAGPWLPLGV
jgi:hypothetical protein